MTGTNPTCATPRRTPIQPRGLCRVAAALYIGVSPTKFDGLVEDGRMPQPKRIDARKIWDVRQLDDAFEALPSDDYEDRDPFETVNP
jgi:hypothetical protein